MITDEQTNTLFLADTLPVKYPEFYSALSNKLTELGVTHQLLNGTRDVWAADYMPVQIGKNRFVQFRYEPDYLMSTIKWKKTISDPQAICENLGIKVMQSGIILDGGNVSRGFHRAIMCDKIFAENPEWSEEALIRQLESLLEVEKIIIIPTHPFDTSGHSDGILRWYGKDEVLINDYGNDATSYGRHLRMALRNAGIEYIEFPYNPSQILTADDATGEYINFLWMEQGIIYPQFGLPEDALAHKMLEQLFPWKPVSGIPATELSRSGGILNCISWNIMQ